MRALFVLLVTILAAALSVSQITVTAATVATRLAVGNSLMNRADTLTSTANIGTPGTSANVWNFGLLGTHRVDTLQSVAVAGTPYIGLFPGATHALRTRQTLQGITGIVFQYLKLGTSLLNPGNAGDGPTILGPAVLKTSNTPNDIFYQLPMTLGTSWTSTYVESLLVTISGFPFINQTTNYNVTHLVDAFGTLTLPGSFGTHQVLRIRNDSRTATGRTISYQFIALNGASVQFTAADTLQPNTGIINISPSTSWSGPVATDVRFSGDIPANFRLMQNYPNPFNPSTTIQYQVASAGFVAIKVYNLLGQEVSALVNEVQQPGTYTLKWNAEGVSSGIYFYRMQSGTFVSSKRMLVVK